MGSSECRSWRFKLTVFANYRGNTSTMGNFIKATYHAITQSCKLDYRQYILALVLTILPVFRRPPYPRSLASACSPRAAIRRVLLCSHSCRQEAGCISVPCRWFDLLRSKIVLSDASLYSISSAIHSYKTARLVLYHLLGSSFDRARISCGLMILRVA